MGGGGGEGGGSSKPLNPLWICQISSQSTESCSVISGLIYTMQPLSKAFWALIEKDCVISESCYKGGSAVVECLT